MKLKHHLCLILSALSICVGVAFAADAPLRSVGVARVDITPSYPIRLTGYGNRTAESEGVAQRLFAKAIAFGGDADGPAVLVTVDNCGVPGAVREEVVRRLATKTKVVSDRFALCSTHNHSSPMLVGYGPNNFGADLPADQQATVERYTRELTDKIEQAALAALADRRPARLAWGVGSVGFAVNRRLIKDGKWEGMGDNLSAPVDHDLPVLRATDADGKVRAILTSYACHCTTLTGKFNQTHGDWAGCAQEALEREFPGAVALVAIGCGADANPSPRGELAMAVQHGEALAAEAQRLATGQLTPLAGALECRAKRLELAFDTPRTREEWEQRAQSKNVFMAFHARKNLARLDRGEQLPTKLPYFVQTWTFGSDMAMVFLAGEAVVDYSLRLKREFGARLWVNSYANQMPCYIPSRRILDEGGYEAEGGLIFDDWPARLAPEIEERIIGTVYELMPKQFPASAKVETSSPQPPTDGLVKTLMTTRGKLLASEDFVALPKVVPQPAKGFASGFTGWRFNLWDRGGKWDVADGGFRGIEKADSLHPAVASYGLRFKDVVIQCDLRLHDVSLDGRRSRYLQVRTTDETEYVSTVHLSPFGLLAHKEDHDHAGPDQPVPFEKIQRPVKFGEWKTVLIEIRGEELVATLDGRSITGTHPLLAADKHSIMFVSGAEGSIRNFRVWEALPNPDWAKNKATLKSAATVPAQATPPAVGLKSALLFHASFDRDANADFATGDTKIYSALAGKRAEAKPGLPEGDLVQLDKNAGRFGGALHFTQKMKPQVFFRGAKNLGYRAKDWSGSCSFWMRLDPDKDLEPGYCDPLQYVAQAWGEGVMFVEFSKDHTPRHFRYALLPITRLWNPANRKWEEIPEPERPMVPVPQPPFQHEKWTHVCFTFGNANTGKKDGWGKLYLDGKLQGAFTGLESSFNWDEAQSTLNLGLNYIGWFDDVAVFNRALTDAEVQTVFQAKDGIRSLK